MAYDVPVAHAPVSVRSAYLKKVAVTTALGLGIASVTSVVSMFGLMLMPGVMTGYVPMIVILASWGVIHFVAQPMVFGGAKWPGFVLGMGLQGFTMGFLLLTAAFVSASVIGNPFALAGLAAGLTGFTGLGLGAYVWTRPGSYSMLGGFLSAAAIPMLVLMAVGIFFPGVFGGTIGLLISGAFVVISAAGLLYQLNLVIHRFSSEMHIEGAYTVAMGILVLFWNILSFLMRLTRR